MYYTVEELKAEIKRRIDIDDVAYYLNLDEKGSNNGSYLCPFHEDSSPSFVAKKGEYNYKCFSGCGTGSMYDLVNRVENISYWDSLMLIATNIANIPESDILIKKDILQITESNLIPVNFLCINYLLNRGIHKDTIRKYNILSAKSNERFLVFTHVIDNNIVAYKSISTFKKDNKKIISIKGTRAEAKLFPDNNLQEINTLYFTAGEFDCMILDQMMTEDKKENYKVVCNSTGEDSFPADIVKQISDSNIKEVKIFYDKDKTGKIGSEKLAKKLSQIKNIDIYVYSFPEDKPVKYDVNDFFLEGNSVEDLENLYRYKYEIKRDEVLDINTDEMSVSKATLMYMIENNFMIQESIDQGLDISSFSDWRLSTIFQSVVNSFQKLTYCNEDLLRRSLQEDELLKMLDQVMLSYPIQTIQEFHDHIVQINTFAYKHMIDKRSSRLKMLSMKNLTLSEYNHELEKIESETNIEVLTSTSNTKTMDQMFGIWQEDAKDLDKLRYIPTPFSTYNTILNGGYRLGEVHLLGADASVGKSTFLIQSSAFFAKQGIVTGYYSLETKLLQIIEQEISRRTNLSNNIIRKPNKNNVDDLIAKVEELRLDTDKNLFLTLCFDMLVNDIISDIEYRVRKYGLQVAIIDHFHALELEPQYRDLRTFLVNVSRKLVKVAGKNNIAVIVACQLKTAEKNYDGTIKKRHLDDFAETASLKRDAFTATILNLKNKTDTEMELSIVKNRDGVPEADIKMEFKRNTSTFAEKRYYDDTEDYMPPPM